MGLLITIPSAKATLLFCDLNIGTLNYNNYYYEEKERWINGWKEGERIIFFERPFSSISSTQKKIEALKKVAG